MLEVVVERFIKLLKNEDSSFLCWNVDGEWPERSSAIEDYSKIKNVSSQMRKCKVLLPKVVLFVRIFPSHLK